MLHFIVAPYHLGERAVAVAQGPLRILDSGIAGRLGAAISEIDAGQSAEITEVNRRIAVEVTASRDRGAFPLVLAGNCNSCLGTLAALKAPGLGIVWFDAHGDFHTPETSISGSLEGMSLTLATRGFVAEERVILAGARDLEPGEDERVWSRLHYIVDADLGRAAALPNAQGVYVHIDLDVLDPVTSPGVNFQGQGGLTVEMLHDALTFTFRRYNVQALAIANYNPSRDIGDRTQRIAVGLIEQVARLRQAAASR